MDSSLTWWNVRAFWALGLLGLGAGRACADPTYTIIDLGTLPGTIQSIATGINAQGQVTGVSYSSSDGTWTPAGRLQNLGVSYDAGAQSFLYTNGRLSQINPVGGPANAINDSGQVVGGTTHRSTTRVGMWGVGPRAWSFATIRRCLHRSCVERPRRDYRSIPLRSTT